ncbi:MAG TPA: protein kinase [Planctomycetota bacterium]|nr:protein kinase [Planctomycetota bacterium]
MGEPAAGLPPFGKYRLLRELGRGGTGIVYEAIDGSLNRRVALKVLAEPFPSAPQKSRDDDVARFLREARLTATLPKHPSIVGLYEADVHEGRRYFAMELIEGVPLSDWIEKGGVPLRRRIEVLREVALAVQHAHEHAVIHRDLKPENILVDGGGHPHVTDFGLAKRLGPDVSLTGAGMVVGTPAYMSPEQAQGLKSVDHRTDVYALGVILYEFLAGRRPFEGETAMEIMMKVVRNPAPPPTSVMKSPLDEKAKGLDRVCLKAIAKSLDDRYPSAQAFAADLAVWLGGGEVKVALPRSTRRMGVQPEPASRAWRWTVAGALVLVTGVAVALALSRGREAPAPAPADVPWKAGAIAEYYSGHNFEVLVRRVVDEAIAFDWTGKEAWPGGLSTDFSARWQGWFEIDGSGPVVLRVRNDDGARLAIDGKQVLDHWKPHAPTVDAVSLDLTKGPHRLDLEYHQGIGEAVISLAWSRDGKEVPVAIRHKASEFRPFEVVAGRREDVTGAQEGESLLVLEGTGSAVKGFEWKSQYRSGAWSGEGYLWWGSRVKPGDRLRLRFRSPEAGRKTLLLGLTKSKDHGIHRISVNGAVLAPAADFYDPGLAAFTMEFREVELRAGDNELEFTAVGTNGSAEEWASGAGHYKLGLDYVLVR